VQETQTMTYPLAFLGGLVSFITPCVLPLVPVYLSILSGTSFNQLTGRGGELTAQERSDIHKRVIFNALAFIIGFSVVFIVSGVVAGTFGEKLTQARDAYGPAITNWLLLIFGIVLVILGLNMAGIWKPRILNAEARFQLQKGKLGVVSSGVVGAAFAFGWTPCIGPILAVIWGIAAESGSRLTGGLLLATYSLGLAVPFFLSALSVNGLLAFTSRMKRHFHTVEIVIGTILILLGLGMGYFGGYGIKNRVDGLTPIRQNMGWLWTYSTELEQGLSQQPQGSEQTEEPVVIKEDIESTQESTQPVEDKPVVGGNAPPTASGP